MTDVRSAADRKRRVVVDVTAAIARGDFRPGEMITPLAKLAAIHGLSKPTVLKALEPLIADGTLRVVPSVGVYLERTEATRVGCYVMVIAPKSTRHLNHSAVSGFETRIARRGGQSLVVDVDTFLDAGFRNSIPEVFGVFSFSGGRLSELRDSVDASVSVVSYLGGEPPGSRTGQPHLNHVDLDNESGGMIATSDLLRSGYDDVAFLGIHIDGEPHFPWSRARAEGWARAMLRSRPRARLVCYQPGRHEPTLPAEAVASVAADQVLQHQACVGADDTVLIALAEELRRRSIPQDRWPKFIGFEGLNDAKDLVVTSVSPGWVEMGARAADRLFDASRGRSRTTGAVDLAPMTLISRPFIVEPRPSSGAERNH